MFWYLVSVGCNTKNGVAIKKLNFKSRYVFVVILALFVLPISSISYALERSSIDSEDTYPARNSDTEPSVFKKSYNAAYQFVNDHEYLLAPLSGTVAGLVRCGSWCAAAGGILGAIDETSIYFGITDRHYLTWGIFGIATGHVIQPSIASDIAGVAFGILLPTGVLNDHEELISPAISAAAGNSIAGTLGVVGGGAAGVIDEFVIYNNVTDKHYMTFCTAGIAATNLLLEQFNPALGKFAPMLASSIGIILGSIAAQYEKETVSNLAAPVKTTKNLYETYGKFIPKDQLNSHIEEHALALVGSQFMVQYLTLKSIKYGQSLTYNFERLDAPNGKNWNTFTSGLTNFAIFLFPYAIGQSVSNRVDDYFCKKLQYSLEDKVRSELFSGETALRLSYDSNTTVLTDNLKGDLYIAINSGGQLVTGAVSASINGVYGVGVIIVSSPNIFIYSALYNKACSFISDYLATQQRFYGEQIKVIDSRLISIMKHDTENIKTITERDGVKFTKARLQRLYETSREYEANQELWSSISSIWWGISKKANSMVNYYLVARELNRGAISFENRNIIQTASWQVSNLLSWPGHNAQLVASIDQSLNRIIILEGKIHAQTDNKDQINRLTKEGNQLILQDLEVGVENRVLVSVKDLKLKMGKVYAVTGESGCGKTCLLSKIKGIKENGVTGKGNIYYPLVSGREPKIVMVSQQDYFPIESSLREIISYPDEVPSDPILNEKNKEEIQLLLKEIGLDTLNTIAANASDIDAKDENKVEEKSDANKDTYTVLNLDSIKDWHTILSGGEKKKILIISAIIKKPDILILDEIFNGLDPKSIIEAQQMLKKYLPNALVLSVDHHAQDNDYNSFYDRELNFYDKNIFVKEILAREKFS